MKPLPSAQSNRRKFPITDCNYQSPGFFELNAGCGRSSRASFVSISQSYFNREARHNFVMEAVVFALITVTVMPAFVNCGRAVVEFLRVVGL
jgi:hypothetical protein